MVNYVVQTYIHLTVECSHTCTVLCSANIHTLNCWVMPYIHWTVECYHMIYPCIYGLSLQKNPCKYGLLCIWDNPCIYGFYINTDNIDYICIYWSFLVCMDYPSTYVVCFFIGLSLYICVCMTVIWMNPVYHWLATYRHR